MWARGVGAGGGERVYARDGEHAFAFQTLARTRIRI